MKSIATVSVFLIFVSACTPKYGIVNGAAYVRENVAGTLQVDKNGVPKNSGISKLHLIYVETIAGEVLPEWSTAWLEGRAFTIKPIELKETARIGTTPDEKEVIISSKPGNRLWQLMTGASSQQLPDSVVMEKIRKYPVVLKGTWKNKPLVYAIEKEITLVPSIAQ